MLPSRIIKLLEFIGFSGSKVKTEQSFNIVYFTICNNCTRIGYIIYFEMKKDEWLRLAFIKSAGDWAPDRIF